MIEVCIALVALGLLTGMFYPTLKTMLAQRALQVTRLHQEQVSFALAGYVAQHNVLPKPADPDLLRSNRLYGHAPENSGTESGRGTRGMIPFQTLGLPESLTLDGYHRPMSYVVDALMLTSPPLPTSSGASPPSRKPAQLHIITATGTITDDTKDYVAFALISHGANGNHAPTPEEKRNLNSSREIYASMATPDARFDDHVHWVMRNYLLTYYGHVAAGPR